MREAVLDTNAFVDVFSCHDFFAKLDELHPALGAAAIDDPQLRYRRARARESLLMAIYLHNVGATTYSLQNEGITILERVAPPSAAGGASLPSDFTRFLIWFVKDYVLHDWNGMFIQPKAGNDWPTFINHPDLQRPELLDPDHAELKNPTRGNADLWHIATAKERGLVLVTNEGFTGKGYGVGEISERAAKEGIRTLFPKDVYAGKMDEDYAARAFLRRFREEGPALHLGPAKRDGHRPRLRSGRDHARLLRAHPPRYSRRTTGAGSCRCLTRKNDGPESDKESTLSLAGRATA